MSIETTPSFLTPDSPFGVSQLPRRAAPRSRSTPVLMGHRARSTGDIRRTHTVPRLGELLAGKYLIESVIGSGGMGFVLSARHTVLETQVAIKLLRAQTAVHPESRERFLREGQSMAALRSEHVTRVMDMDETEDGVPFLVMEYLEGENLAQVIRQRAPLPVDEAVSYMLQVCEAVLEAHARGTFHRDIKPGNIFVTTRPDGTPLIKVLDFGIAKVLAPGETVSGTVEGITQAGQTLGTSHYMPPEQIQCARTADARSDIWSLGVVLYELATGKKPFSGQGQGGVMASVVRDHPLPPRSLRPDLPEALDTLIMHCLEKSPEKRPQWVAGLVAALAPFTSKQMAAPVAERQTPAPESEPTTLAAQTAPSLPATHRVLGPDSPTPELDPPTSLVRRLSCEKRPQQETTSATMLSASSSRKTLLVVDSPSAQVVPRAVESSIAVEPTPTSPTAPVHQSATGVEPSPTPLLRSPSPSSPGALLISGPHRLLFLSCALVVIVCGLLLARRVSSSKVESPAVSQVAEGQVLAPEPTTSPAPLMPPSPTVAVLVAPTSSSEEIVNQPPPITSPSAEPEPLGRPLSSAAPKVAGSSAPTAHPAAPPSTPRTSAQHAVKTPIAGEPKPVRVW